MDVVCDSPEEQHHSSLSGYNSSVAVCDERIRYAQYDNLKVKFRLDNLVFRTLWIGQYFRNFWEKNVNFRKCNVENFVISKKSAPTLILNFKGQQLKGSTVKLFAKIRVGSCL